MPPRKKPTVPVTTDRKSWLEAQLQGIEKNIAGAEKAKSWNALATLRRQAQALRDALDVAPPPEPDDPYAGLTPEQQVTRLRADLESWPDKMLVIAVEIAKTRGIA